MVAAAVATREVNSADSADSPGASRAFHVPPSRNLRTFSSVVMRRFLVRWAGLESAPSVRLRALVRSAPSAASCPTGVPVGAEPGPVGGSAAKSGAGRPKPRIASMSSSVIGMSFRVTQVVSAAALWRPLRVAEVLVSRQQGGGELLRDLFQSYLMPKLMAAEADPGAQRDAPFSVNRCVDVGRTWGRACSVEERAERCQRQMGQRPEWGIH
mmetsp:Transcript_39073/g.90018  ORF Transcript_39073/g.90018 Transcript_39073/m.90018 type:complete len:212 (+) Transcript_39073:754-1389(+)